MTNVTNEEIEYLVRSFQDCTLPRSRWNHQAHLTVALWYLVHYPLQDATQKIRQGIQAYNIANGIQITPTSGYHETLTQFWICAVQKFIVNNNIIRVAPDTVDCLIQELGHPDLPLRYYSRDRLMSWEARTTWVEPDL